MAIKDRNDPVLVSEDRLKELSRNIKTLVPQGDDSEVENEIK